MSGFCAIAENPALVRRLFINQEYNPEGIYKIRLFKGEWIVITVDDYIPCVENLPYFTRGNGPELWVILLEKACAKFYGCYSLLNGGSTEESLRDLTSCPT